MSKDETLDMLEKINFRGVGFHKGLNLIRKFYFGVSNLCSFFKKSFFFKVPFLKEKCFYFRFLTIQYWESAKRFSDVGITDGM